MDKSVRVYHSHDEMKADEYRYWQSRPVWERMDAVSEHTTAACALKGWALDTRFDKTLVRVYQGRKEA
jgi:hypothetical protein